MKFNNLLLVPFFAVIACSPSDSELPEYQPKNQELYEAILAMDKAYFDAYNTCDMETQASIMADDIEFFHDQGGLVTDKEELLKSIEVNICGKVTRELVDGTLEVYEIANYGAVAIGYHKFFNKEEPDAPSIPSKFIGVWRNNEGAWQMTKVVSLHN